ncbi:hypothetical protein AUK41_03735 [Candidatus Berkelbacteria bacterium CG2_30_43_20]|nr:MAG: hypothetical protein AUK41_03735 [Candidatus Berkelbacteria bacterium CG2_30_43_20]
MHRNELSRRGKKSELADIILGGQDGLVNVLGVILGISAASGDIKIIIAGGLAATFAESISMGAVALTSKLTLRDHYKAELAREKQEIAQMPEQEKEEIRHIFAKKGLSGKILDDVVEHVTADEKAWLEMMMREELGLEEVKDKDIYTGSFVVFISALIGSFIPLAPFFFMSIRAATIASVILSALALLLVGIYKAKAIIGSPLKSGLQMVLIGMGAALAGYVTGLVFQ